MRRPSLAVALAAALLLLAALLAHPATSLGQPLADAPPPDPTATVADTPTPTVTATATATLAATATPTATETPTPGPSPTATPAAQVWLPYLVQSPPARAVAQPGPDDGGTWTAMRVLSLDDVWLGTSRGSLYHLVGGQPRLTASLSTARVTSISAASDGSLWAVTEAGEVLQRAAVGGDADWHMQAALGESLSQVSAVSVSNVWALRAASVWRWDGVTWRNTTPTSAPYLSHLVAVSASEACGASGRFVWRWDGAAWSEFRDFDTMRISDLAVGANGQVWVAGVDPQFPSYDPRVAPGAQLLWVWNGTQWGVKALSLGYAYYAAPPAVNQRPDTLCVIAADLSFAQGVQCFGPPATYTEIWSSRIELAPLPIALGMVTPRDGWALTSALYRIHIRP